MRLSWLWLGLLVSCARIPLDPKDTGEADADTDADADADADTDADTDTDPVIGCGVPSQLGPWWKDHPLYGKTLATAPPKKAAGLTAVREVGNAVADVTVLKKPLQVRGAVVTMIGHRPAGTDVVQIWVADAEGGLFLRYVTVPEAVGLEIGDVVDFDVNVVDNYGGLGQVANEDSGPPDYTILTEGIENFMIRGTADVWVTDAASAAPLTAADEGHLLIEAYGEILDSGAPCGGDYLCYTFEYAKGETIAFRSNSKFIKQGDCLQYIGPMGSFNGPQIDATDYDWHHTY